ncbi:OprO/OprP family phosphate-selective porin [Thioalkalivibrio sulfidiphilus]|uniref:OprO/OprP family phosphate-selective porin n=1 Tax=Thioalkalivibrio sulfidiphilus TaxID=1033854 RepID=UPI000476BC22|nr:porin [Thioalkalivibrio sulfidiphilus]
MKKKRLSVLSATAVAAVCLMPATAHASESQRLMDLLIDKGIISQQEAEAIRREVETPPTESRYREGTMYDATEPVVADETRTRVRRFRTETVDGSERFGIRGRLMIDAARQELNDSTAIDSALTKKYGTAIRRARLGALGLINHDWEWQLEVDYREEEVRMANAYLAYLGVPETRLLFGHVKEPFSMESNTSSRYIMFIERATPIDAYRPDREIGFMYESIKPDWYLGAGIFGSGLDLDREVTEGYSLAMRGSFAPLLENDRFVHLGGSVNYRENAYVARPGEERSYEDIRLRSRLGTRVIDGRLIGRNDLDDTVELMRYGLEFAAGVGPFLVQSEYVRVDATRDRVPDATLDGFYIQGSWFLTGERRTYRATHGDFAKVYPNRPFNSLGGTGAWELALRYATADGIDGTYDGGKMDHYTLGLNWFPHEDITFKFNAIYLDAENAAGNTTDGWVYALRAQYEF